MDKCITRAIYDNNHISVFSFLSHSKFTEKLFCFHLVSRALTFINILQYYYFRNNCRKCVFYCVMRLKDLLKISILIDIYIFYGTYIARPKRVRIGWLLWTGIADNEFLTVLWIFELKLYLKISFQHGCVIFMLFYLMSLTIL